MGLEGGWSVSAGHVGELRPAGAVERNHFAEALQTAEVGAVGVAYPDGVARALAFRARLGDLGIDRRGELCVGRLVDSPPGVEPAAAAGTIRCCWPRPARQT